MLNLSKPFLLGLGLVIPIGLLAIRFLGPIGFMDLPNARKVHSTPVPRVGGITLIVSLIICWLLLAAPFGFSLPQRIGITVMLGLGICDDIWDLSAKLKAIVSLAIALFCGISYWLVLPPGASPVLFLGVAFPPNGILALILIPLLLWGLPQTFNLIDGANGLAIGFSFLLSLVFWVKGMTSPFFPGALLGLLVLNFPHSRLFLGDCGSLTLGLIFGFLGLKTFLMQDPTMILWVFAYPIVDVVLVIAIRVRMKRPLGAADQNHIHHHLRNRLNSLRIWKIPTIWALAGSCSIMPILPQHLRWISWVGLTCLILLACSFFRLADGDSSPSPLAG